MSELITNCPRCGSQKITFDVLHSNHLSVRYQWQRWYEVFCVCRHCHRSVIFVLSQKEAGRDSATALYRNGAHAIPGALNDHLEVEGFVSTRDLLSIHPPEFLPEPIKAAFVEGVTCLSVECYNAAATMFRLCLDLATTARLPMQGKGLKRTVRRSLGRRLEWLFTNGLLPSDLQELSRCVKDDGNDGAHAGSLEKAAAEDLMDFTVVLLERLYTEPERLKLAAQRRDKRRSK